MKCVGMYARGTSDLEENGRREGGEWGEEMEWGEEVGEWG